MTRFRDDIGGALAVTVVVILAGSLAILSEVWPAADLTPSDDRQPATELTHAASDLPFTAITNGLGPVERNHANGGVDPDDGDSITIAGQTYEQGLGVSTPSAIRLYPDSECVRFTTDIGIDDSADVPGSAVFRVEGDGRLLYESVPLALGDSPRTVELDVEGVERLDLTILASEQSPQHNLADWAEATLVCTS